MKVILAVMKQLKAVARKAQKNILRLRYVQASEFFLGFLCNCFNCFIAAKITFTSMKYEVERVAAGSWLEDKLDHNSYTVIVMLLETILNDDL